MSETSSNNKRIAKNTLMLYVRMIINMAVSLYTSRVVLEVLGVEDFGVYNVVGGVVGMLGFLNATMSGATSRFLTYELGKGDKERLSLTFNSALIVHIAIALIVFLIAETLGLWFVYNKIVIPDGRMTAAFWVYQFSILSAMISITQVPYNASIIAHERLDVYAYVEIVHTFLKLLIVYLLLIIAYDKLIIYAGLVLIVTAGIAIFYRIYCLRNFEESHFQLQTNRGIIKEILSFSGYNVFGNFGFVANSQGRNIIINNFFGVVFNAASGIAFTVANTVTTFANNVTTVFRPPIIKAYAQNNYEEMKRYVVMAINLSNYIIAIISIPSIIEMDTLLNLWLVEVPPGASIFAQLIIVSLLFQFSRHIMTICIHAKGRVKDISIINGLLMTLSPIFLYICYLLFPCVVIAFILNLVLELILLIISIFFVNRYIPYIKKQKIFSTLLRLYIVVLLTYLTTFFISEAVPPSILRVVYTTIISSIILSAMTYLFCLNKYQKQIALSYIKAYLSSFFHKLR